MGFPEPDMDRCGNRRHHRKRCVLSRISLVERRSHPEGQGDPNPAAGSLKKLFRLCQTLQKLAANQVGGQSVRQMLSQCVGLHGEVVIFSFDYSNRWQKHFVAQQPHSRSEKAPDRRDLSIPVRKAMAYKTPVEPAIA